MAGGRARALCCAVALVASAPADAPREPTRDVLLAAHDVGWIHVLDAETLATIGRIRARPMAMRVAASGDGRTLFVNQAGPDSERGCCALYAFELATRRTCSLLYPSQDGTASPDGKWLFAQRGNVGIDLFDLPTFSRLPALEAPPPRVVYDLRPSPDGRWLFAQAVWKGRWIDVFDLQRGVFARRIPVTGSAGAWLGESYYMLGSEGGQAVLTRLAPRTGELSEPRAIVDSARWVAGSGIRLTAGAGRLYAWTPSAPWLHRAGPLDEARRGIRVIDPATARVERHLLPGLEIADLATSRDGATLYAAAPAASADAPPTLIRLVLTPDGGGRWTQPLSPGFRSMVAATLPRSLTPSGDVAFASCAGALE